MEKNIKDIVDIFFGDIPYSEQAAEARDKICSALNTEFEALCEGKRRDEAFEELLGRYGRLSDMAVLAGYSADSAEKWREGGEAIDLKTVRKELRRQRWRVYIFSLLAVGGLVQTAWGIYDIFTKPAWAAFNLLYAAIFFGLGFVFFRSYRKNEKAAAGAVFDTEAFQWLRQRTDRYTKRLLNSIALLFAVFVLFFFSELSFYVFGNSKSAEFAENIFANIIILEIPVYLLLKNILCSGMLRRRIKLPEEKSLKKHVIGITALSAGFWAVVTAVTVMLKDKIYYPANIFLISGFIFAVLVLLYNVIFRKKLTYKNIVFNPARFAVFTAGAVFLTCSQLLQRDTWYTQPYINAVPVVEHNVHDISYNEATGVYTITSSAEDFKILHLTDIHIGGSLYSYRKDIKALQACYTEIEYTKPDLVIVTGDLCFPLGIMSMSLNNSAPVYQFAAFMRNTGIPWAFTYGNHDTESLASANKKELNEVYKSLSYRTSGNLLYPYVQPEITGRNNQLIEVRNSDGSLNTALFLIDSNAYTGEGINVYDYIHDDQVEWYAGEVERLNAEEGHTVNSMAFFHIPLQQYRTAYELYESGSDEVTYFFGENGEKMINKVCCSDYPSSLFDKMLELGSTTGTFCGHDHYNNMSLEYKGIRLTYGMSIDYLAMPGIENDTEQRGAELITLHSDSSWELEQIPLTDIT